MSVLEKLSKKERVVREHLYYLDGTAKVCTMRQEAEMESDKVRRMTEALLDKHSDDEVPSLVLPSVSFLCIVTVFLVHCKSVMEISCLLF
jgi:hypothetical protein